MDILNQEQLITTPALPDMEYVVLSLTVESQIDFVVKIEKGDKFTPYTVAPEDVAIFTESTGGGAA